MKVLQCPYIFGSVWRPFKVLTDALPSFPWLFTIFYHQSLFISSHGKERVGPWETHTLITHSSAERRRRFHSFLRESVKRGCENEIVKCSARTGKTHTAAEHFCWQCSEPGDNFFRQTLYIRLSQRRQRHPPRKKRAEQTVLSPHLFISIHKKLFSSLSPSSSVKTQRHKANWTKEKQNGEETERPNQKNHRIDHSWQFWNTLQLDSTGIG